MVDAWGATVSMAWARLVRTLARSAAICGVTDPLATQAVPEPDADPEDAGQLVLEAGAEVDVVGPVLQEDEAGRVPDQVGRRQLVGQVPGLLRRDRALAVAAGVVGAVGHGAADGELVAASGGSWSGARSS